MPNFGNCLFPLNRQSCCKPDYIMKLRSSSLISEGNEVAFAKLFEYYRDRIYSIAFKFTHSATAAEEITADVFLKIWLKRNDLGDIQNFSAYLFAITRNEVYRVFKLKATKFLTSELNESSVVSTTCDAEDYLMEKEYNSLLQKAIDGLPERQRQVYQLSKEREPQAGGCSQLYSICSRKL